MKKNFYFFSLFASLFLFTNCGPTLKLRSVETLPEVQPRVVEKADGIYALKGTKYQFSGEIKDIQYAPQWQLLGVNYEYQRRKNAYSIYDLQQEKVNWANIGDYQLSLLQEEVAMVSYLDKKVLLDMESSLPIRWVDGEEFVVIDDSIALNLSDRFSRVNLKTGKVKWFRPGEKSYTGWISDKLDGDWMFLVGDNLHGFDINNGHGWQRRVNTEYDASRGGRAVGNAFMVGLNILSASFGGTVMDFPYFEPLRAHNVHTQPKIVKNQLYFADRQSVMSLNKHSGKVNWEQRLLEELGVSDLKVLPQNRLLLVGKGYRYVNYALDKDKTATIYLLDSQNGQVIKFHKFPKEEIILDFAINDQYIYVCTSSNIHQFDLQLLALETTKLPETYGAPFRVVTWSTGAYDEYEGTDDPAYPLIIRTFQGLVALHPVTLKKLWYQRLGSIVQDMPPVLRQDRWQLPILLNETDLRRSWIDEASEIFWFGKANKVVGLDLLQGGEKVSEFEFSSDNFWFIGDGTLVQYGDREVQLLQLEPQ